VNGLPAARTELHGTEPKSMTKYRVLLIVVQGNAARYQLRMMAPEAEWASQKDSFERIAESLRVSNPSAP
jgi:hypothetical protein